MKYLNVEKSVKDKVTLDMNRKLKQHEKYIVENGVDLPEIENWNWNN